MEKSNSDSTALLVVIVNYFSASLVTKLVQQLSHQALPAGFTLSIVCANNSCTKEQSNELKKLRSTSTASLTLIENTQNLGFGDAINKAAGSSPFDLLCCINPDVSLFPNSLQALLSHCQQHETEGIWGGLTVNSRHHADFRHAWQEPTLINTLSWSFGLHHWTRRAEWQDNYQHVSLSSQQPYPVDSVSGCFMLISNTAWQAIGGFDKQFFLYSEEIDLCRRAREHGFQPTVVPQCQLQHAQHPPEESTKRLQMIYSSKLIYAAKHHGLTYNIVYRCLISLGATARAVVSMLAGKFNLSCQWSRVMYTALLGSKASKPTG